MNCKVLLVPIDGILVRNMELLLLNQFLQFCPYCDFYIVQETQKAAADHAKGTEHMTEESSSKVKNLEAYSKIILQITAAYI